MKNTITKGSEVLVLPGLQSDSNTEIIVNEDCCVIGKIVSYNESTGAVSFTKIWDTDETKTFYGKVLYRGQSGIPVSDEVEGDSIMPFFRVGEFNSTGVTSPELRTESASNFSWVGFVGKATE